jgi:peptidoglycan/xylan/chitin deacetylase (PgdA/CDA1 family)
VLTSASAGAVHRVAHSVRRRRDPAGPFVGFARGRIARSDPPAAGRAVALTFDDGPGPYTHFAIDELRRARARVTWFLVGRNLTRHEGVVRQEQELGELADHTWTHPSLPALSAAEASGEISRTQAAVSAVGGRPVRLFRPPYGARTPQIDAEARRLGLVQVLWNVDSADSAGADKRGIARNTIAGLHPGSIVLLHENRGQTIAALRRIIPALHRRHLRAVTLPELLATDPPSDAQLRAGPRGCRLYGGTARGLRAGAAPG